MSQAHAVDLAVVDTCVLVAAFNRKDDLHEAAVEALGAARILLISPLVLAELDYLLTGQAGERTAVEAVRRLGALTRVGRAQIAGVDGNVLGEAEGLMTTYLGQALGLADTVNAVLAWRLRRSVILSFDHHYADVIAPRTRSEQWLEVVPGPTR